MKIKQFLLITFSCLASFFVLLLTPTKTYAQVIFSDDFSNGYEKWQDVRNTFDLWSIVEETADVFVNRRSTLAELIPKNEYWNYDWKNYIYKVDYTYLTGADKLLSFWYQDTLNWYQFHFVANSYILSHIKDGQEIWKKSGGLVLRAGGTYKMEVHLDDGNIKLYIDDEEIFQTDDPTFDNDHGTIGIKSGAGNVFPTHVQFDNIEVTLISDVVDFILNINPLKQTDPTWKDIEYDSATSWATNSFGIGDWGCLVTSINMILDFHKIVDFPDGSKITPESLNHWLNQEEDGYVGPGLVNWSAITRLVKQIHDIDGSVNLEYSRLAGEGLDSAITEIQNQKPVILEIPGHFLVGNGFTQLQDDLFITDPAYSYNLLSQHDVTLKSTRLLTPSYTDLSYLHVTHDNKITSSLKDDIGNTPNNYQTYNQKIKSFSYNETSPEYVLNEFSKPDSGVYILEIISNDDLPISYSTNIFAYDIDANLSNLTYSGVAGTLNNQTTLTINYDKNGTSNISSNVSFNHLLNDIHNYSGQNQITKQYVSYELSQLTTAAVNANQTNKSRYINAIQTTIDWYSNYISESATLLLNQRLIEIQNNL